MKLTFFDLEASAAEDGYPIELGFAELDLETGEVHSEGRLIKPATWWQRRELAGSLRWDLEAEKLHGISKEMLVAQGRPVIEVATWAAGWIEEREIWSDNTAHDGEWLSMILDEGLVEAARPTYRVSALPPVKAKLPPLLRALVRKRLLDDGWQRHRAEDDAVAHATFVQIAWQHPEIRQRWRGTIW